MANVAARADDNIFDRSFYSWDNGEDRWRQKYKGLKIRVGKQRPPPVVKGQGGAFLPLMRVAICIVAGLAGAPGPSVAWTGAGMHGPLLARPPAAAFARPASLAPALRSRVPAPLALGAGYAPEDAGEYGQEPRSGGVPWSGIGLAATMAFTFSGLSMSGVLATFAAGCAGAPPALAA